MRQLNSKNGRSKMRCQEGRVSDCGRAAGVMTKERGAP